VGYPKESSSRMRACEGGWVVSGRGCFRFGLQEIRAEDCNHGDMSHPLPIVCKPTPWFLLRALAMLLMFGVFSVLFYIDGSTGYRKKNEVYYLHQAFRKANDEFSDMNSDGTLTAEAWKAHAARRTVELPEDLSILPVGFKASMPWPEILHDYDKMRPLQVNLLWREYSRAKRLAETPPDEPFDARKIGEQWVVFWICLGLAGAAAFILVRTLRRTIRVDEEAITSQAGKRVPFGDLKTLDLRKWDTKGIAFADYDGPSGKGRLRIDGLTYGGFKADQGEPAEKLMQYLRSRFSGEIIEYAVVAEVEEAASGTAGSSNEA